ncbi:MAG: ribosomal RNA small subunit methyltransferase A [Chloroflexi bacterium]|nr:ribosomal RNA small subunit methyltransferase A [Chloroflexota bacterium]
MGAKSSLEQSGLRPRKKWGQNFLTDRRILTSIADAADVNARDTVLEIGPGLGHLTRVLATRAAHVVAVEVDADLADRLQNQFLGELNIIIYHGDILQREPAEWIWAGNIPAPRFKVVANLPYYITSAILRHLLEADRKPSVVVVMVQRQVAQRMMAKPPDMNLLAVSVQFYARVRLVRTIAPGAFYPKPKVESAVVRLDVYDTPPLHVADPSDFFELVRAGFGERRKQLRNALARGLDLEPQQAANLLARAQIDATRRAETLSLDEWGVLYRAWVGNPIAARREQV